MPNLLLSGFPFFRLEFDTATAGWWGGELVRESVSKTYLLSDHFDVKQSRESVDMPLRLRYLPPILA